MKLIKMPSIEQFRSAIHNLSHNVRYEGINDNGDNIYNTNPLPILKVTGNVKIHGTNAALCYNINDGLWFQSKKNIITSKKDNGGFAFWGENNLVKILELFDIIFEKYGLSINDTATIYGEWAGRGIQGGVGISEVDKTFYIFGIKITPNDKEKPAYWVESNIFGPCIHKNIYHINEFKIFELDVDFNNPSEANNKMFDMVMEVEKECPVAKYFGVSGIGEGIVFRTEFNGITYIWKAKGDKHAEKSKKKIAKKVDNVRIQLLLDIAEEVCPSWRLDQMYVETFDIINGGYGDIKKTGDYIRSVIADILKEDSDILIEYKIEPKELNKYISTITREYLMDRLNKESGL